MIVEERKRYFLNRLILYVNTRDTLEEKSRLLNSMLDTVDEENLIKLFSELDCFLSLVNNGSFESVYEFVLSYKDKASINEVINMATSLNKKSRIFYEYFMAKKYGYLLNSKNQLEDILKTVNYYLDMGATKDNIISFTNLNNTVFSEYKDEVLNYLDNKLNVYTDSNVISSTLLINVKN